MELRQEKKNNTLRYILLCVLAGLVLAVGAAIRTVYGADIFVAFEHDKLYKDYKESNPITGEPLSETGEEFEILAENEFYAVKYKIVHIGSGSVYPKLLVERKTDGLTVSPTLSAGFITEFGVEDNLNLLSPQDGYYNPYEKAFEPCMWAEISDDKIIIRCLAVENFFDSGDNWPNVMTIEQYDECFAQLETLENSADLLKYLKSCYKKVDSETATGDEKFLYNLENTVRKEVFDQGVYIKRMLSVRTPDEFEEIFDTYLQWTAEDKRAAESKVLVDDYEAVMAMVTFALDISSELPTLERSVEFISPRERGALIVPNYEDIELSFE